MANQFKKDLTNLVVVIFEDDLDPIYRELPRRCFLITGGVGANPYAASPFGNLDESGECRGKWIDGGPNGDETTCIVSMIERLATDEEVAGLYKTFGWE